MLQPGDQFPEMKLPLMRGGEISLPSDLGESWSYVAFYRGHW